MRRHFATLRLIFLNLLFIFGDWPFSGGHGLVCGGSQRAWLAPKEESKEAKSPKEGTFVYSLAKADKNHQKGGQDLEASRDKRPKEAFRDHGRRTLEMPMRMDEPGKPVVVSGLSAALHSSQVRDPRTFTFKEQVEEEADAGAGLKTSEKTRPSTPLFSERGERGGRQEGCRSDPMAGLHPPVKASDPSTRGTESQGNRDYRSSKQGFAQKANRGIQGLLGRKHNARGQGSLGQNAGEQRSATQALACDKSRSGTQGIFSSQDHDHRNGSRVVKVCHESPYEIQFPTQGLHEGKRRSPYHNEGKETSLGGSQGGNPSDGERQTGGRLFGDPGHGGNQEAGRKPPEAMGGPAEDDAGRSGGRRGRDGGSWEKGPIMCPPQEDKDGRVNEVECTDHAPRAIFKAAGHFLNENKRLGQWMGLLSLSFGLSVLVCMGWAEGSRRICRCRRAGHERIARKHFACGRSTKRILIRWLCQYLFLWHHLGFPCAQISRRDVMALRDRYTAYEEETSWMQTQTTSTHATQTNTEESTVQDILKDITHFTHTTSIVVWQHPILSRWTQVSAALTVIIDPRRPLVPQILSQLPRVEEWVDRRWTRLEKDINWGFARRPHLIVTQHHSFERLDSVLVDFQDERRFLGTILIPEREQQPIHEAFELLKNDHRCHEEALCFIRYGGLFDWDENFAFHDGQFLEAVHQLPEPWSDFDGSPTTTLYCESTSAGSQEGTSTERSPEDRVNQGNDSEHEPHDSAAGREQDGNAFLSALEEERHEIRRMTDQQTDFEGEREFQVEIEAIAQGDDERRIHLVVHGIRLRHITSKEKIFSTRDVHDLLDIIVLIRQDWLEHIGFAEPARLILVWPQPPVDHVFGSRAIHLIFDMLPFTGGIPMLFALSFSYYPGDWGVFQFYAVKMTEMLTEDSCIEAAHLGYVCYAQEHYCRVSISGYPIGYQERQEPQEGGMVVIFINIHQPDPRLQGPSSDQDRNLGNLEEQGDEHSLMQFNSPSFSYAGISAFQGNVPSKSSWVYGEGTDEPIRVMTAGALVEGVHLFDYIREYLRIRAHPDPNVEIFEVHSNPEDLLQHEAKAYIRIERIRREVGKVIILLDVEFYTNDQPMQRSSPTASDAWREGMIVTKYHTRRSFFDAAGLGAFCNEPRGQCLLNHRGRLWWGDGLQPREIKDGDFLQIQVHQRLPRIPVHHQWRLVNTGLTLEQAERAYLAECQIEQQTGSQRGQVLER